MHLLSASWTKIVIICYMFRGPFGRGILCLGPFGEASEIRESEVARGSPCASRKNYRSPQLGCAKSWVPGCWHFKKHRLVSWVMAGCEVSPGRFSRGGLIWRSPLMESRLTAASTRFGKAACLLTHRPTHAHVRPGVYHHRQTVFGRKGGTRKSPKTLS